MSAVTIDADSCSTVNQASRIGNVKTMCCLIEQGHPVDVSDNRGWKATHEAARGNFVKCLEVLLKQEATDVNWVSFEEASALLVSAEHGHVACLRLLLDGGADPNLADNMGNTPLLAVSVLSDAATKVHSLACVELLVERGADVNCQQYCGTSPLHQAVSEGLEDILSYLIEKNARLDVMEEYHISPVFAAAQYGQTACLKMLLDSDKDTASSSPRGRLANCAAEDGATPLFLAAQEGHTDCLRLLLQHGADANLTSLEPVALPLHAALQFAHVQCVKLLLQHTDQSVLAKCHASVFNFASMHESRQCTKCLIAAGVDVNARHRLYDYDEFVPKLLHYIEHDVTFSREMCPLATIAFYQNHVSSAEVLLANGSDPNVCISDDVPPLLPALDAGNLDLVRLLVAHGASVNVYHPNIHGNMTLITCLHFWRGLMFMLKCGAEVGTFLKSRDSRNHDGAVVSFLQTVIGAKYLMSQAGIGIGQVIYRMLQFVGPLTLNDCVEQVLDSVSEWNSIAQLIGSPRSLMHSCRLVIRDCVGSRHLVNDECFRALGLPPPVVDYLSYKDL